MKIVILCECKNIHSRVAVNDEAVTQELLQRLKQAAHTLGLQVHIGPPDWSQDWSQFQDYVEDMEEYAAELEAELEAESAPDKNQ